MFRIKGHRGTSSLFIKLLTTEANISFSRQGLFQYFHLPNFKPNRFTYHVSHQCTISIRSGNSCCFRYLIPCLFPICQQSVIHNCLLSCQSIVDQTFYKLMFIHCSTPSLFLLVVLSRNTIQPVFLFVNI